MLAAPSPRPDDFVDAARVSIDGVTFAETRPLAYGPGRYEIEISDSAGGAVMNVPIFVGVPYAPRAPTWPIRGQNRETGAEQAREALQKMRAQHGLGPLERDARLDAVAADHLADMLANHWTCHCWSDGSSLLGHLLAA